MGLAWSSERATPRLDTQVLIYKGVKRHFHIHYPRRYEKLDSFPLVIALHGGGGRGRNFALTTSRFSLARATSRRDVLLVYPDGIDKRWNDGRPEPHRRGKVHDDVGFLSKLIDVMILKYGVDPKRVYVTGMSNGGFMSLRLGLELTRKIAAIAPVTAQLSLALQRHKPDRPLPVMFVNGTADPLVPYDGGHIRLLKFGRSRGEIFSVEESVKRFVKFNTCSTRPEIKSYPDSNEKDACRVIRFTYSGGRDKSEVVLLKVIGGGHNWPGGSEFLPERLVGKMCRDINASELILDFFLRHKRD